MGRLRRGRRAGMDPAIMPILSSMMDQRPMAPVLYMNSWELL